MEKNIFQKIDACAEKLRIWGKKMTNQFKDKIKVCSQRMNRFRGLRNDFAVQCYSEAVKEYEKVLAQQEDLWKQRAKQHWLRSGNCNTKYFHAYASSRRKKNSINQLQDENGILRNWSNGLDDMIGSYYNKLFQSQGSDGQEILDCIEERVSMQQNEHLTQEFTGEEVKEAIFSMHPDKGPGPDGMNLAFYQRFWKIIGKDVTDLCLHILSTGCMPQSLNDALVVLILKNNVPEFMGDLRPISLCNVLINIVTKMLANRMKIILPSIISKSQSAFILGRLITDNVVAAFEVNHWMHMKTQGKMGFSALKLDMTKAYDRVEWNFLRDMMRKMGFANKWVEWVYVCVSRVKYSVLLSGKEIGPITPSRGLRQGDPVSPYLFLICAEGLSAIIRRREEEGSFHDCKIARSAPSVSHLFFADDSYLSF